MSWEPGVFITFDVECGMGGASGFDNIRPIPPDRGVWGRYNGFELGIPLITDIMSRYDVKGTFFVEAFMKEQGYADAGEAVCEYLLERGHDVQLHIHPNRKRYASRRRGEKSDVTDQIADLPAEEQLALLQEGAERIQKWTGARPTAFRAGNMGASKETLEQLSNAGLSIDSSYTFPYAGGQCRFSADELYNGSKWYGNILELGLSGFQLPPFPGLRRAKPLDLMGISYEECRNATQLICDAGADSVVILHSFTLFKVKNTQYDGGRLNRINTQRFERYCNWVAESKYPARTFCKMAQAVHAGTYEACRVPPCQLSRPRALLRKAVQAWNGLYWT